MTFLIEGLSPEPFLPLAGLDDAALAGRGVLRRIASSKPGFPCRVTLEDAEPGEAVLLLNYESLSAPTPYRSRYAIYVREGAAKAALFEDAIPPVLRARPVAFRHFDAAGMLVGASLALKDDARAAIEAGLADDRVAFLDAHNAAHGCFAARIRRAA